MRRAAFIDKDGTLVEDLPFNADPDRIRLVPDAGPALRRLREHGFLIVVVSNQPGVALGRFGASALDAVGRRIDRLLAEEGAAVDAWYWCPHHPDGTVAPFAVPCRCRKPAPGLLRRAAREHGIGLDRSWMVGDILDDVEAGHRAGCKAVLLDNGNETEWRTGRWRRPETVARTLADAAACVIGEARRSVPS